MTLDTRQKTWQVLRWGLAITASTLLLLVLLTTLVRAQSPDLSDPFGSNEALIALATLVAAWVTKLLTALGKDWFKTSGTATVALSAVIAAIFGGIGGWFALGIFSDGGGGLNGAITAIGMAVAAFLGSNASAKSDRQALAGAIERIDTATSVAFLTPAPDPQSITDYLLQLIRERFGSNVPTFVWAVVETIAREFAGQALNETVRATIQRRFLDLLAKAGAPGHDL
ncbi:MAG: hypothetical protein LC118_15620 [Dehalococcoidia bacterium]|nr:hypothetical protein [Dehalococcoidia bacterium]